MPFKTPHFWYREQSSHPPLIERLLSPISTLYKFGHNLNLSYKETKRTEIPVICVGNITAGGGGKTPTIIALNKLIKTHGFYKTPYFLSRGYGGSVTSARCIDVHCDVKDVGDEPLLLVRHSKTIISVNRYLGAELAHALGADCVLMDDGFQNPGLFKNLSILVIDGKTGFGNKKLFPAGPLREPIEAALDRAQAVIIIGEDQTSIHALIPESLPVFTASMQPSNIEILNKNLSYIGFAGLAHPRKFYDTLQQCNIKVTTFHEFADHHPYSSKDINNLIKDAKDNNARLITTEKDYQRIPVEYHKHIDFLPIELIWDSEKEVIQFLKNAILSFKST